MSNGSIVVLSDSLAYYGPEGGLAANDPRIWPNLVARKASRPVQLVGRIGWTMRDGWWALTQDPQLWAAMTDVDVVVIALGGMDTLPSPLPTAIREDIRFIRPSWLRSRVRAGYSWLQPRLSPLGWPVALPATITVKYLEKIVGAIRGIRPDVPVLLCLPPTHRSPYYGYVHSARVAHTTAMQQWADAHDVATVSFYDITARHFGLDLNSSVRPTSVGEHAMNPDGIHWGFECHRDIADRVANALPVESEA